MSFNDQIQALVDRQGSIAENDLLYLPVTTYTAHSTGTPGASSAYYVILGGSIEAIHKPISGVNKTLVRMYKHQFKEPAIHDCAAWRLAHAIGGMLEEVVAPTVMWHHHTTRWGSLSKRWLGTSGLPAAGESVRERPDQADAAAFFDSLIGQQDRNVNNLKWDAQAKHLGLFDHGFAFALPTHPLNTSFFVEERWKQGRQQLAAWEAKALNDLLASYQLHGVHAFLARDRAKRLEQRAQEMIANGTILPAGSF